MREFAVRLQGAILVCYWGLFSIAISSNAELYTFPERFGVVSVANPQPFASEPHLTKISWYYRIDDNPYLVPNKEQIIILNDTSITNLPNDSNVIFQIGRTPGFNPYDSPYRYAQIFHQLTTLIRKTNPSAKISFGSIFPGQFFMHPMDNFDFIKRTFTAYYNLFGSSPQFDIFHLEIIFSSSIEDDYLRLTCETVNAIRKWMSNIELIPNTLYQSYTGKELWITIGIENPQLATLEAKQVIEKIISWLVDSTLNYESQLGLPDDDYRLVQRWSWFPLYSEEANYRNSRLFESPQILTPAGETYFSLIPTSPAPEPTTLLMTTLLILPTFCKKSLIHSFY